jgi:hypothetical protein
VLCVRAHPESVRREDYGLKLGVWHFFHQTGHPGDSFANLRCRVFYAAPERTGRTVLGNSQRPQVASGFKNPGGSFISSF